jgi:LysR family transcriptional regulator, glycine cleavage system transcriptional activator
LRGLVRPFEVALRLSKTYWIVCPKATASLPKIAIFRDRLLAEAAADAASRPSPDKRC